MNPSLEVRIGSMTHVLADLIMPNLTDTLAFEQARLVLGHLQVIKQQADYMVRYEELECQAISRVAEKLRGILAGGTATKAAGAALAKALTATPDSPEAVRKQIDAANAAVEALLKAGDEDGDEAFRNEARKLVLAHEKGVANRARSWFGAMGFEPPGTIDSIPDMMKKFEEASR